MFKGACTRGIDDNMKTALDAIFVGKKRTYDRRFLQLCSHYLVDPVACTPAFASRASWPCPFQIGIGRSLAAPPSHTTGHTGPCHGGSLDQAARGAMDGRPSAARSAFESAMSRAGLAAILSSKARRPPIRSAKQTRPAGRGGDRARCPRFGPRGGAVRPVWTAAGTGSSHCAIASRRLQGLLALFASRIGSKASWPWMARSLCRRHWCSSRNTPGSPWQPAAPPHAIRIAWGSRGHGVDRRRLAETEIAQPPGEVDAQAFRLQGLLAFASRASWPCSLRESDRRPPGLRLQGLLAFDRLLERGPFGPPRQRPDPRLEPGQRLRRDAPSLVGPPRMVLGGPHSPAGAAPCRP